MMVIEENDNLALAYIIKVRKGISLKCMQDLFLNAVE